MKRLLIGLIILLVLIFLAAQLVPSGRQHANPPILQEPAWDSPQTRQLARDACFDCHSNETAWPWYSNVAPVSWLVTRDVQEGRRVLNFSEWGLGEQEVEEIGEVVLEGEMPPRYFLITHPEARLSPAEKQAMIDGFAATFGVSALEGGEEGEDGN